MAILRLFVAPDLSEAFGIAQARSILAVLNTRCQTNGDVGTRAMELHITRNHRTTDIYCAIVTYNQCSFCVNTVHHRVVLRAFVVCPVKSGPTSTFSSVNWRLQTLTLCKTTLRCTLFEMSEVGVAEPLLVLKLAAASQGQGPSASRRRLSKGAKNDGGSHSFARSQNTGHTCLWSTQPSFETYSRICSSPFLSQWTLYRCRQCAAQVRSENLDSAGATVSSFSSYLQSSDQDNADGERALRCGRSGGQDVLGGAGPQEGRDGLGGSNSPLQVPSNQKTGVKTRAGVSNVGEWRELSAGSTRGASPCRRRRAVEREAAKL